MSYSDVATSAQWVQDGAAASGRRTSTRVPSPGILSILSEPLCAEAIWRAIGSPSPVPSVLVEDKRIKHVFEICRRDPASGIGHHDTHVERVDLDGDGCATAGPHGLGRVEQQVDAS